MHTATVVIVAIIVVGYVCIYCKSCDAFSKFLSKSMLKNEDCNGALPDNYAFLILTLFVFVLNGFVIMYIFVTQMTMSCVFLMYACSHLMGMFYRTIRMIENGIKPVYVFDGKPPDMKSGEVCKNNITGL